MSTTKQINLQELIVALSKLKHDDGKPQTSIDLQTLIDAGLHHAHLPDSLKVSAAEMFQLTAEGIGGLPRMMMWADRYPASFYKLYARQTIPTITPVLPKAPEAATQEWPSWLTARRLAYQEEDRASDLLGEDEDAV